MLLKQNTDSNIYSFKECISDITIKINSFFIFSDCYKMHSYSEKITVKLLAVLLRIYNI